MRAFLARQLWKLECRLNKRLPVFSRAGTTRYLPRGQSKDVLAENERVAPGAAPAATSHSARLLLGITTYGRPEECGQLLQGLQRSLRDSGRWDEAFVVVVRDTSEHDYGPVLALLESSFPGRFAFYEGQRWLGKAGRYLTYQVLFDSMRALSAQRALFFEDDVTVSLDFIEQALSTYDAIEDADKAVLYLAAFDDDEQDGRWVRAPRQRLQTPPVDRTQWFDLHAFAAGRRFFETLNWRLFRPHGWRWVGNPQRSSGVSEQMTLRLWGRANIYQVRKTLAYHGEAPSMLNAEARRERSLNNFPGAARD